MMISILAKVPVVPVLTIERLADAVPLARALIAGGLPVLEITRRTPRGFDAAAAIREEVDGAVVGIGTVLTEQHLILAHEAGARFAVSPGFSPSLVRTASSMGMAYMPGIATPSEAMAAQAEGAMMLKFFPAGPSGGPAALSALAGPFPDLLFCPTGGIGADNARAYLALPNVVCVGGSWVAPAALVAAGDWHAITDLAREAAALASESGPNPAFT
jgi:2-dehydro-3-deoxyphosphogluconate aldolase/(4S)-4-hydroxy-2-oxoglutarate aldolase